MLVGCARMLNIAGKLRWHMYLVDTDIMIDIQRSYAPALAWFASLGELPNIPGFVVMELIQDAQNKQQVRKVLQMVAC